MSKVCNTDCLLFLCLFVVPLFVCLFVWVLSCLFVSMRSLTFLTLEFVGIVLRLFQQVGEFNRNIGNVINSHVHLEKLYMVEKNKLIINIRIVI